MKRARFLFKVAGFADIVEADEVVGTSHARDYFACVGDCIGCQGGGCPVSPILGYRTNRGFTSSHFRPVRAVKHDRVKEQTTREEQRVAAAAASPQHRACQESIARLLPTLLLARHPLPWRLRDPRFDCSLSGDLLFGVRTIAKEHWLTSELGKIRPDIALVGPGGHVYAALEIEFKHPFDAYKAHLARSWGIVLATVDVRGLHPDDLTVEWVRDYLVPAFERPDPRVTIYVPDILAPLYVDESVPFVRSRRHQYLVFSDQQCLTEVGRELRDLSANLGLTRQDVSIRMILQGSRRSRRELRTSALIAGVEPEGPFLRVTMPPLGLNHDSRVVAMHQEMTPLMLQRHEDVVIGLKPRPGARPQGSTIRGMWTDWGHGVHRRLLPQHVGRSLGIVVRGSQTEAGGTPADDKTPKPGISLLAAAG